MIVPLVLQSNHVPMPLWWAVNGPTYSLKSISSHRWIVVHSVAALKQHNGS